MARRSDRHSLLIAVPFLTAGPPGGLFYLIVIHMLRASIVYRIVGLLALSTLLVGVAGWRFRMTRPTNRLALGQEAARSGDFTKAEQYALLLEQAGDKDRGLLLRGEIQFLQKEPVRALSTLSRIKDDGPQRVAALYLSARCLISLRRLREAEDALRHVCMEDPNQWDARRELAAIYYDQGDFSRAIALLEQVADLDRSDATSPRLIGQMFKDMDQPAEALPAYRESLRRDPNPPDLADIRVELGECLLKLHKDEEVLDLLRPDDSPPAVCVRVEAMIGNGRGEEAMALLEDTLRNNSNHGGLLRLRAERYRAQGDTAIAANLLERVVAEDLHDFRSQHQLALCYDELARMVHGRIGFLENPLLANARIHQDLVRSSQKLKSDMHDFQIEAMNDPWNPKPRERLAELSNKLGRPELAKMWRAAAEACRKSH
jgi:tetratricopeptide (TPR) repeat protein